jgi:non-specific serine/threonine protein kinase
MPHARAAATAVTVGERVFVAGGIGANGKPVRELLEYDPGVDRWSIEPEMPTPREHLGGASFGGKVYTVGGRAPGTGNLAAFEVYDPRSRTWESLPDLPTRRGGLAATATCNGQIVAVGGEADVTFFEAEAFDVASGTWRSLPGTPTARHGLGVVADGATVHAIAGGRVPGLSASGLDETIDLSGLGPCG